MNPNTTVKIACGIAIVISILMSGRQATAQAIVEKSEPTKSEPTKSEPTVVEPTKKVTYKTIGDTDLKLHVFEPADHKTTDPSTAVVFFFGGGWNGGTPKQFYEQSRFLADKGVVCFSADYRVKSRHKVCLLYTSPSPRDQRGSRMPSSA